MRDVIGVSLVFRLRGFSRSPERACRGPGPRTPTAVEEMEQWLHVDRKNSPEVWVRGVVEVKVSDNCDIIKSLKLTAWKKA